MILKWRSHVVSFVRGEIFTLLQRDERWPVLMMAVVNGQRVLATLFHVLGVLGARQHGRDLVLLLEDQGSVLLGEKRPSARLPQAFPVWS